jgi:hypothetical protein
MERHLKDVIAHHIHDERHALILEAAPTPPAQIDRADAGIQYPACVLLDDLRVA